MFKKSKFELIIAISLFLMMSVVAASAGLTGSALSVSRSMDSFEVTGTGFGRFETVRIVVESRGVGNAESDRIAEWSVSADIRGAFQTTVGENFRSVLSTGVILRAEGTKSGISESVVLAAAADLDQCANGTFASPVQCTGANWQNGNVGSSNGHYYEGDSIPYRLVFSDLTVGVPNTVTIEWDTTQGGKHAIDYITTYNRTENVGNNPCSGVLPACGAASTFPIPLDPNVGGAGVAQIPGQVFTMWGATISSVSAYTLSGSYGANSSTRITLTFTPSQANPVLAWSGHIAEQADWALLGGSASDINGSPYHTRLIELNGSGGNQDRSLSTSGVRLNSEITIIKQASPEGPLGFGFSTTGSGLSPFTLWDDGVDNDATPNNISFRGLLGPGGSGNFTITEASGVGFYLLSALNCTSSSGATSTFSTSVPSRTASITLQYGDTVTCTFTNFVTTAAGVSASGRVVTSDGTGIARARVTITNTSTGEVRTQITSGFGYFNFDDLTAGDFYVARVEHKRFSFVNESLTFTLNDAITDLDFTAEP